MLSHNPYFFSNTSEATKKERRIIMVRTTLKRLGILVLVLAVCVQFASVPAFAMGETRNTAINNCVSSLTMNTPGVLTCTGGTSVKIGYTAKVIVELQVLEDDWETIATWSDSGGMTAAVDQDYTATRGETYQLRLTHLAYNSNGNLVEMITDYSGIYSY